MKKISYSIVLLLGIMLNIIPNALFSETLSEIVSLSLSNSYKFKMALEKYNEQYMYKKMATGYLLPTISLDGNYIVYNKRITDKYNQDKSDKNPLESKNVGYDITLKLAQPLFNYQAIQQYQKASIIGDLARTQLEIERNNIILTTVQAYLKVLSDKEKINYLKVHAGYIKDLKKSADAKVKVGQSISMDVDQINAQIAELDYNLSVAKNNLITDMHNLDSLVGLHVKNYASLSNSFVEIEVPKTKFEEWQKQVLNGNLNLILGYLNLRSAKYDVNINKSSFYPTISLFVSHSYTNNKFMENEQTEKANTLVTDTRVGLNLNINLFKGGLDVGSVTQSNYKYKSMQYELEQLKTDLMTKTNNYYYNIYNGTSQIKFLVSSAKSIKSYLDMVMQSYSLGLKTNNDTLNAAQKYSDILNKISDANYGLILSILSLKAIAGHVSLKDVQEFDKYFKL